MDALNGSFDKTEFDLASAEDTTIENAPTDTTAFGISGGAITKDQKIGTITVKITSDTSDFSDTTMVKNLEDLRGVFENGGKAKLNNDLNGTYEMLTLSSGKDLEFDLNRKTLSVESISLSNDGNETLTLRNGTIGCYVQMNGRAEQHLIVDNCTLDELCDNNNYSDVTLRDCVIKKDCFTSYGGIWKFEGVNNITGTMKVKKDVTISGDFTLGTLYTALYMDGTFFPVDVTPSQPTGFTATQTCCKHQFKVSFIFHALPFKGCNKFLYGFLVSHRSLFLLPFRFVTSPCGIVGQITLVHSRRQDAA